MQQSTLRIAWRNLARNRRRTGLALCAIAVGQLAVVVYSGVMHGYSDAIVQAMTGPLIGDVEVTHRGWRKERAPDLVIEDVLALSARLRQNPAVRVATPRSLDGCLIAVGENTKPAWVVGVDPMAETGPSGLLALVPREQLPGKGRVLLGQKLAPRLGAKVGDELALIGQTLDGSIAQGLFHVAGLLATPATEVETRGVVMSLADAQDFFGMADAAQQIIVRARPGTDPAKLAAALTRIAPADTEVVSWREAQPVMARASDIMSFANIFMLGLLIIAAIAGITNTMMMSTFERVPELGMLLGLGCRPGRIVAMIFVEAVFLGLFGVVLGTALGTGTVAGLATTGVDLMHVGQDGISFGGMAMPTIIHPRLEALDIIVGFVAVILTSLLAALWPASFAAKLEPMEALRS